MDRPSSIDHDGDVFVDAFQHFPAEGSPEPSDSASRLPDPPPEPKSYYPAATIRRRSVSRGFADTQSSGSSLESDLVNVNWRSFQHRRRHRNLKKDEHTEKPDLDDPQQVNASTEENNEGSTVTSAANDDAAVDSVDSAPRQGSEDKDDDRKWVGERFIPSKHKVQVTVELRVPESGYNRNLGIFQIRVDFLLPNGKAITSSSQPCMLRFRSQLIRLITTLLKIVPLVTGYTSETQTLNVKMRGFEEGDLPTSCLKVTLEQRAEYQPGAGIPEIYDASLIVESELPLFKRLLWLWKMSIFIWIAMMAFFTELLFALVCCTPIIIPKTRQRLDSARRPATLNRPQALD